jgi:hypothetical protein
MKKIFIQNEAYKVIVGVAEFMFYVLHTVVKNPGIDNNNIMPEFYSLKTKGPYIYLF